MTHWTRLEQTDNSNGLVMVIRNYRWLNSASWVLISTCSAPLVQTGEQFFTVWPRSMTMTYNPRLAKVKVDPHAKSQRSNGSNRRAPTDKQADTHMDTTKRIISPATRSIIITPTKLGCQHKDMPEEWTPDDVELATLSDALCIDSVPVVRLFGRHILPIRAVLLGGSFSGSSLLKITSIQISPSSTFK